MRKMQFTRGSKECSVIILFESIFYQISDGGDAKSQIEIPYRLDSVISLNSKNSTFLMILPINIIGSTI